MVICFQRGLKVIHHQSHSLIILCTQLLKMLPPIRVPLRDCLILILKNGLSSSEQIVA